MKTSNKILIVVALLFLIVPLSAMLYDSRNYKDRGEVTEEEHRVKRFDEQLDGFSAIPTGEFSALNILQAKDHYFVVSYVKDAKYGVKIATAQKDNFEVGINSAGTLEVKSKGKEKKNRYVHLYVYAPSFNTIRAADLEGIGLQGEGDSIQVWVKKIGRIYLSEATEFKDIGVNAVEAGSVSVSQLKAKSLTLSLEKCSFFANDSDLGSVVLSAKSAPEIEFTTRDNKKVQKVQSLQLNTVGRSTVYITNTAIDKIGGSLSDSTTVNMPVTYIRQLIK